MLSDKEQAVFDEMTKQLDESEIEQSVVSRWRRGRHSFRWLTLVGLVCSVVFFPGSLLGVGAGLLVAAVGMWGICETRVAGTGHVGRVVADPLGWLENHGIISRWSVETDARPERSQLAIAAFGAAGVPGTNEWHHAVTLLAVYTEREHSTRVPREHMEDGFALGRWVVLMRVAKRIRELNAEQIKELEAAGMNWNLNA